MTADFDTQLTALLDDVAGSITPRADYGAVRDAAAAGAGSIGAASAAGAAGGAGRITSIMSGGRSPRPFRRGAAVAAAAVLVVAGSAAAFEFAQDDSGSVATTPDLTEPGDLWSPADGVADDESDNSDDPAEAIVIGDGDEASDDAGVDEATDDQDETDLGDETDGKDGDPAVANARSAKLGLSKLDHEPPLQWFHGRAPAGEIVTLSSDFGVVVTEAGEEGEWKTAVEFAGAAPGSEIAVEVAFAGIDETFRFALAVPVEPVEEPGKDEGESAEGDKDEQPVAEEPPQDEDDKPEDDKPEEPAEIAFTAVLGWAEPQSWGMKVGLWGSATPGSVVELGSEYGFGRADVNEKGEWQMIAELEMPAGTKTVIIVESSASDRGFEFLVERPAADPARHAFSASIGASYLDWEPPKQYFVGTGQPGSVVVASSPYGSAEKVIGESGEYELKLLMPGAPAGAAVPVQVTNTGSDQTFSFELRIPAEEPAFVEFTANAVYETCDEVVPYNEYFGTAMPGTVVLISSPYGSAEVVAGEDGGWEKLVEFPSAPRDASFVVQVKSIATGQVKEFTMTVGPSPGEGEGEGDK